MQGLDISRVSCNWTGQSHLAEETPYMVREMMMHLGEGHTLLSFHKDERSNDKNSCASFEHIPKFLSVILDQTFWKKLCRKLGFFFGGILTLYSTGQQAPSLRRPFLTAVNKTSVR